MARYLVPLEMSFFYLCLIGGGALLVARRMPARLWPILAFCTTYTVIHVYSVSNMGALYRMRAFAFVTIVCALLGALIAALARAGAMPGPAVRTARRSR